MKHRLWGLLLLVLALAGCSGMRIVDSDVRAFTASQGVQVPATYRFEILPSQQAAPQQRDTLERIVQEALEQVGMQRDDGAARYSVRFDYRLSQDPRSPWDDDPFLAPGFGMGFPIVSRSGMVYYFPMRMSTFDRPWYRREVTLLVRRLSDGALVFESSARHDGYWSDDLAVLPAMFEAALRDFPNPPEGPRRVNIEIPR